MPNTDVVAANEIYDAGKRDLETTLSQIDAIRDEERALGVLQMIDYQNTHNEMLKYAVLFRVKEKKAYKKGGMTWDEFCTSIGESSRNVGRILSDMTPIYSQFSDKMSDLIGVDFRKIRLLGRSISDKVSDFDEGTIIIDDQKIELKPENKDAIEDALQSLKEKQAETSKRLSKLEKEKESVVKEATKSLEIERDALIRQNKELAERVPKKTGGIEWYVRELEQIRELAITFGMAAQKYMSESDKLPEDRAAQGQLAGIFQFVEATFHDLRAEYEEKFGLYDE